MTTSDRSPEVFSSPMRPGSLSLAVVMGSGALVGELQEPITVGDGYLELAGEALLAQLFDARLAGETPRLRIHTAGLAPMVDEAEAEAQRPYSFFGDAITVNPAAHSVFLNGNPVELTNMEYNLTAFLGRKPGFAYSRGEIFRAVWGWSDTDPSSTITVHVRRVREKLGAYAILTKRKYGYAAAP